MTRRRYIFRTGIDFRVRRRYFDFRDGAVDRNFLNSNHVGRLSLAPFSRDPGLTLILGRSRSSLARRCVDNETAFAVRDRDRVIPPECAITYQEIVKLFYRVNGD